MAKCGTTDVQSAAWVFPEIASFVTELPIFSITSGVAKQGCKSIKAHPIDHNLIGLRVECLGLLKYLKVGVIVVEGVAAFVGDVPFFCSRIVMVMHNVACDRRFLCYEHYIGQIHVRFSSLCGLLYLL